MKHLFLKFKILLFTTLSLAALVPFTSYAQALDNNAGSGAQLFCKRDFSNFLVNGLDFDGEGFIDYWNDIIVIYNTNYCRYQDIDGLLNRIDQARKQIRQAFYVCDNVTSARVSADYYQLSAELYYLRHFVETADSPSPKSNDDVKKQKVALKAYAKAKFLDMFVNKLEYFNQSQAEAAFTRISQKYESKVESYKNCVDPNWEQLLERIDNMGKTFDTINNLGKRFAEKSEKRWTAMEKRVQENPGLVTVFSSDGLGDFFNRVVDLRANGEPAGEATIWESISNTAKENAPFYYGTTKAYPPAITYETVVADLETIDQRTVDDNLDLQYASEYDLKYRQVEGLGLEKLKINLEDLKTIIDNTFAPLTRVEKCTANILGKQCGG